MKVTVMGAGWVGIVSAAAFAKFGHEVTCTDIREERIVTLQKGDLPFFEPGLFELVAEGLASGKLLFKVAGEETLKEADVVMCAVGTPPLENGSADLSAVFECAREFGRACVKRSVFVIKSTVPAGTAKRCKEMIEEEQRIRRTELSFAVASNPEFLAEGNAVRDVLTPERVIVGCDSERFHAFFEDLYAPLIKENIPVLFMSVASSELTKYAANAFLATKLSFINEIANYAEIVGANPQEIVKGIGLDSRTGPKFLRPGVGYGGSCFPKDVRALVASGIEAGYRFRILPEVDRVNTFQRVRFYEKLSTALGGVKGRRIVLWGLSYKPETDDTRESPALYFIDRLEREGADVLAYDPMVKESIHSLFPNLALAASAEESLKDADAVVLLTEWSEFSRLSVAEIRSKMRGSVVVDGRGVWKEIQNGIIT
jgi:UDPglucose 6-dehydrogenase